MTVSCLSGESAVIVEFPLRGEWVASNTPSDRVPSHGTDYFGQRYAFDFKRYLGKGMLPYRRQLWHHFLGIVRAEECYSWSEPVFAPFGGEVVDTGDGWPDRKRLNLGRDLLRSLLLAPEVTSSDYRPLTGNYVLIEGDCGVALLAHLRCSSVRVNRGQEIKAGEVLGEVGNSGNTTMPHLHFHVMDGPNPFKARGVLCKFRKYERCVDGKWQWVYDSIPNLYEPVRLL